MTAPLTPKERARTRLLANSERLKAVQGHVATARRAMDHAKRLPKGASRDVILHLIKAVSSLTQNEVALTSAETKRAMDAYRRATKDKT